ncbi:MAG: hypothetical protein ACFFDI_07230 [Promethearchaeota archaeon]
MDAGSDKNLADRLTEKIRFILRNSPIFIHFSWLGEEILGVSYPQLSMANIPILAMLFGIIGTSQLHLAKAMERQCIEIFDQIKAKLKIREGEDKDIAGGIKKPVIYTVGMVLNHTVFVWQMLGASFGLASHYTSMFGLGLIVLMVYSSQILKEKITRTEYVGAAILITGTLILGFENMNQQSFDRSNVNAIAAVFFLLIFLLIGVIITRFTLKKNIPLITGILFGFFAGGCGCFRIDWLLQRRSHQYHQYGGYAN